MTSTITRPKIGTLQARQTPELLAPAGDYRSLVAAVQSGADAVYLGLTEFSARRGAANFSADDLASAVRYAHLRGCKVYVAMNILVLPEEMGRALVLAGRAREAGVDAFIVQDLGLARVLASQMPDVRLHASTQLSTHTSQGAAALGALGFDRVTLARELTLPEIADIAKGALAVEVFIHGALCFAYSGQCLLSSMVGGRSGNRGLCVQACRMTYDLLDERLDRVRIGGDRPLCTKDLCAIELIPDLMAAGVSALKIEGRLKSAEYVAIVVDAYRRALDRYLADPSRYDVSAADLLALSEAFSRGFTPGYMAGIRDHRMMSPSRASDRGVPIGRIEAFDRAARTCDIKLAKDLAVGDRLEVWVAKGGRVGVKVKELRVGSEVRESARAGEVATVDLAGQVRPRDRIFRIENARLLATARERLRPSFAGRAVTVDIDAVLRVGEDLVLAARSADGFEASVCGPKVERASRRPAGADSLSQRLSRLGGTAYVTGNVHPDIDDDAFTSIAAVNEARQRLVEKLDDARLAGFERERLRPHYDESTRRPRKPSRPQLCVSVDDADVAGALARQGLCDWLYFDVSFTRDGADRDGKEPARQVTATADEVREGGGCFALQVPAIVRTGEFDEFDLLAGALGERLDGIVAGSLGELARHRGRGADLVADIGLNVTNAEAVAVAADAGASRATLSPEITGEQIAQVASHVRTPLEVVVFGSLQVMIAEHCVYSSPRSCAECAGRQGILRDAKGFEFPVRIDRACRTRVYNPFDISLVKQLPELSGFGIDAVRLALGGRDAQDCLDLVATTREILSLLPGEPDAAEAIADRMSEKLSGAARTTTAHYFRPVT